MKRTKINPESAKHRDYRLELMQATPKVINRAKGMCEVCGHERLEVIHHRLRRSHGGGNDLENLLGLCSGCHGEIHLNPAWAYEHGYLLRGSLTVVKGGSKVGMVREDLPLANDETDEAIRKVWEAADEEVDRANALFDWVQGGDYAREQRQEILERQGREAQGGEHPTTPAGGRE